MWRTDASLPRTRGDRRPKVVEALRGRRRQARGSLSSLPSATAAAALVRPPGLSGVRAGVGARPGPRGRRSRRCRFPSGPGRRKVAGRQLQGRQAAPPRDPQTAAPPASSQPRVPAIRGRRGALGPPTRPGPERKRVTGGRASNPRRQPPSRAAPPAESGRSRRRAPAGPVTTPAPGRRRALPAARAPPTPLHPSPRRSPGPAERPVARPRPGAPCRLTCAPRRLRTSSPAPRAPSGHAPTPGPGRF